MELIDERLQRSVMLYCNVKVGYVVETRDLDIVLKTSLPVSQRDNSDGYRANGFSLRAKKEVHIGLDEEVHGVRTKLILLDMGE